MTPNILIRLFRRHGPWLTPRAWYFVGGFMAGIALVFTFVLQWR